MMVPMESCHPTMRLPCIFSWMQPVTTPSKTHRSQEELDWDFLYQEFDPKLSGINRKCPIDFSGFKYRCQPQDLLQSPCIYPAALLGERGGEKT